jgi:hypothetical protein
MVLMAACFATHTQAQNLIPNPDFNSVLLPWGQLLSSAPDPAGVGLAPQWVPTPDFNANPGSGSA